MGPDCKHILNLDYHGAKGIWERTTLMIGRVSWWWLRRRIFINDKLLFDIHNESGFECLENASIHVSLCVLNYDQERYKVYSINDGLCLSSLFTIYKIPAKVYVRVLI